MDAHTAARVRQTLRRLLKEYPHCDVYRIGPVVKVRDRGELIERVDCHLPTTTTTESKSHAPHAPK